MKTKIRLKAEPTLKFQKFTLEIEKEIEHSNGELTKETQKWGKWVRQQAVNQLKELVKEVKE